MDDVLVPVTLPSGSTLIVAARPISGTGESDAETPVLGGPSFSADSEQMVAFSNYSLKPVLDTIEEVARELAGVLDRAAPAKASVEFGVELTMEAGKLAALLVNGSAKGTLKITLEWSRDSGSIINSSSRSTT